MIPRKKVNVLPAKRSDTITSYGGAPIGQARKGIGEMLIRLQMKSSLIDIFYLHAEVIKDTAHEPLQRRISVHFLDVGYQFVCCLASIRV